MPFGCKKSWFPDRDECSELAGGANTNLMGPLKHSSEISNLINKEMRGRDMSRNS
jgi:hypothetical protein